MDKIVLLGAVMTVFSGLVLARIAGNPIEVDKRIGLGLGNRGLGLGFCPG